MANVRSGNTLYIDAAASDSAASTTGNFAIQNLKVLGVVVTSTNTSAVVRIKDVTTDNLKIALNLAATGEVRHLDLSNSPIVFPNGISPGTITNAIVTLIIEETRG